MTRLYTIGSLILLIGVWASCSNEPKPVGTDQAALEDSLASCSNEETVMDPNNTKPMALMMRQMAANMDSIKSGILRGETPDSTRFPFIRFYLVEPTDPKVLEPQFFENARLFQESYNQLMAASEDHKKYYNLVIGNCVKCHESYCSGPLKRIRKLPINE